METDSPFATNPTLPHEPADLYADGTWYLSMSFFDGVIESGFLPLGPNGETYLRLDIDTGAEVGSPPNAPSLWTIHPTKIVAGERGVQIRATYFQAGSLAATEWAWWRSTEDVFIDPDVIPPDETMPMVPSPGLAVLDADAGLFGPVGDVVHNVLLRTRRNDGTVPSPIWVYSENIVYEGVMGDGTLPNTPLGGALWTGRLPEGT